MALDVSGGFSNAETGSNVTQQTYGQSSLNSIEQFLSPIRIEKGHPAGAQTPGFREPNMTDENGPFGGGGVGPTVHELDPYFPQIFGDDGSTFINTCDYRIMGHDGGPANIHDTNIRKYEDKGGNRANINTVHTMAALRGPMIMSGWGFGMDDLPEPHGANPQAFHSEVAKDRAQWKTGPVHLMWDDERQVWAGGHRIVCGVATTAITKPPDVCSPTTFTIKLLRNVGGISTQTNETVVVQNRDPSLEQELVEKAIFVIAIKLNYEWLPLWVGCPEEPTPGASCVT